MEIIWILQNRDYFSILATADTFFSGKRVRIAEKMDPDFWHATNWKSGFSHVWPPLTFWKTLGFGVNRTHFAQTTDHFASFDTLTTFQLLLSLKISRVKNWGKKLFFLLFSRIFQNPKRVPKNFDPTLKNAQFLGRF